VAEKLGLSGNLIVLPDTPRPVVDHAEIERALATIESTGDGWGDKRWLLCVLAPAAQLLAAAYRALLADRDTLRQHIIDAIAKLVPLYAGAAVVGEHVGGPAFAVVVEDVVAHVAALCARVAYLQDLPLCRVQFPDGGVPGNTEEALAGWHRRAEDLRHGNVALAQRVADAERERDEQARGNTAFQHEAMELRERVTELEAEPATCHLCHCCNDAPDRHGEILSSWVERAEQAEAMLTTERLATMEREQALRARLLELEAAIAQFQDFLIRERALRDAVGKGGQTCGYAPSITPSVLRDLERIVSHAPDVAKNYAKLEADNAALRQRQDIPAFVARVDARAEADMLAGRSITGAHHRAILAEMGALASSNPAGVQESLTTASEPGR